MFNRDLGGAPHTDGIFNPGRAQLVQAVEVCKGGIIRHCNLEALASWEGPANILGYYVVQC